MSGVATGVPLASGKSEIFEIVLRFLPDWVQVTVLALIVLAVVVSWIMKLKRKIAYRRALRAGRPVHAAAQYGQGRGADHLGPYAPQQAQQQPPQQAQQQGGADFLGSYAPRQPQGTPAPDPAASA